MNKTNIPEGFPYAGETCFVEGSVNLKDYLMGGFKEEKRNATASIVLASLMRKYGLPQCGRNRASFISKKYVIKFPLNDSGEKDNNFESSFVSVVTARGKRLVLNGFECVIQEKLRVLDYPVDISSLPNWVKEIDSVQIGYSCHGILKAYDFPELKQNQEKLNKVNNKIR